MFFKTTQECFVVSLVEIDRVVLDKTFTLFHDSLSPHLKGRGSSFEHTFLKKNSADLRTFSSRFD